MGIGSNERSGSPRVVILGGGPAGVGAAWQLARQRRAQVTLLERQPSVGGNAGSFQEGEQWLDYGSHRLHSATDPEILADIRSLLGDDLADRPRNGRIRLRGRWVKFPLAAADLLLRLDKAFAAGAATDMIRGKLPGGPAEGSTFASVLRAKLGPTICEHFYFPYARKLWGHAPEMLSGVQAHKRVSASSFTKLLKKVVRPPGSGRFFYPKEGFGQISRAYASAAIDAGADLRLGWTVEALERPYAPEDPWRVRARSDDESVTLEADYVWSTLPVPVAVRLTSPAAPAEVLAATQGVTYRAMVLVYVVLDVDRFGETDAHYFPEENVRMTRLSEPKNYFGGSSPAGRTTLCAEIPCAVGDEVWTMSDEALGRMVVEDMAEVGLAVARPPVHVFARRLPQAYPIYLVGYERPLSTVEGFVERLPRFLSYGRQGLFAHDNTHHALAMAYGAVDCLSDDGFDAAKWASYREIFKTHVVED